jgi:hypothetical protein
MEPRNKMLRASSLSRESPRDSIVQIDDPDFDALRSQFDSDISELTKLLVSCSDDDS